VKKLSLLGLVGILFILGNCSKDDDPVTDPLFNITSITPESGSVGTAVGIVGVGFSVEASENIVKFNGIEANVLTANETTLAVLVPENATTGVVTVTTAGKTATGPEFTVTEPTPGQTYYITFKANGTTKVFESSNPGYQSCGQCACSYMPVLNDVRNANVSVCNDDNDWVTAADILGWNGDKFTFGTSSFPVASFGFTEASEYYGTENVSDQTGSEVNITNVVADGNFAGKPMYKVTGNFKCKVAKSGGATVTITDGTFVIRYSED
jgi:IPT/TIG domain